MSQLNLSQYCPPYSPAVVLAVFGAAVCCRVEVAAIERFIELFGDALIGFGYVQSSRPIPAAKAPILIRMAECGDQSEC